MKTVFKELPVKLTEDELKQRGQDLARLHQDLGQKKSELKHVSQDFKTCITDLEGRISNLSRVISNRYEYRETECYWEYDSPPGHKTLIRMDTHEDVERQPLTEQDRQTSLTD